MDFGGKEYEEVDTRKKGLLEHTFTSLAHLIKALVELSCKIKYWILGDMENYRIGKKLITCAGESATSQITIHGFPSCEKKDFGFLMGLFSS